MHTIQHIFAREILDSRGNPTVEVDLTLESGSFGRAAVASGASTGVHEAHELRDDDIRRYHGKGVQKAVKNVNTTLAHELAAGRFEQSSLDKKMLQLDGTPQKEKLGANALLGISLAFAKAVAQETNRPLYQYFHDISKSERKMHVPIPMMNILNGGRHADGIDFQECMIIPRGIETFREQLRAGAEIFHTLRIILKKRDLNTAVGDEGGYAPQLSTNKSALDLISLAITQAGYAAGKDIFFGIDVAASELYDGEEYNLACEHRTLTVAELVAYYQELLKKYPLLLIEDGMTEDDWDAFEYLTEKMGRNVLIVGDDLFVTHKERLKKGIEKKAANAILIKPNQVGTVTETIETVQTAQKANFKVIISHRSGETEDTSIADLSVGVSADYIKTGSLSRGERIAKYNRLLRIEEELKEKKIGAMRKWIP